MNDETVEISTCKDCDGVGLDKHDKSKHCMTCFNTKDPKFWIWEVNNKLGPVFMHKDHFVDIMKIYNLSALQTMRALQRQFGNARVHFMEKKQ